MERFDVGPDEMVSDDELTALALAADPDLTVDDDALPIKIDDAGGGLLPEWYMPAPTATRRSPGRTIVVGVVIAASIAVNAAGLCVTYGVPEIAW